MMSGSEWNYMICLVMYSQPKNLVGWPACIGYLGLRLSNRGNGSFGMGSTRRPSSSAQFNFWFGMRVRRSWDGR